MSSNIKLFLSKQDLQLLVQRVPIPGTSPAVGWSANYSHQYSWAALWAFPRVMNSLTAHWMCPLWGCQQTR